MEINLLKQLIIDQLSFFLQKNDILIERDLQETYQQLISSKQIIVITGVRRSGKSSLLKLISQKLINDHQINNKRILYLNFEDEMFVNFKIEDYNKILTAFYEINGEYKKQIYCFFDEIQNMPYWEKWISKLYSLGRFKIFITGSNSTLLSSEIATALTGRNYTLELFPFSFKEYLYYHQKQIPTEKQIKNFTTEDKAIIKKEFDVFLMNGGIPESFHSSLNILDELYKNIIYKDIITRFNIKNSKSFREVAYYLISNSCAPISYRGLNKVAPEIASSMTIKNYLDYLNNAYLIFPVRKLEASIKKQFANPFKIYNIDNGLMKAVAFSISDNFNKLYENLVYLALRRKKNNEIFYYKNKFEVDFIVKEKKDIKKIIQVCYNLQNEKTRQREINGLLEAAKNLGQNHGYIINDYLDKEEKIDNIKIIYLPLWKWLLL